ncbi:MAG: tetratricopeptide repeat protein [Chroococcidiopsidaceae cyanobacterium CP_BM_RX_35]|nr:tetratricopeptide repeat protein [Chroococcidiopsidaceae cyanobacterium CP_BM_RX_35]
MQLYNAAIADFNRALKLDPNYAWAIANRGETYLLMQHGRQGAEVPSAQRPYYDAALADLNRAIDAVNAAPGGNLQENFDLDSQSARAFGNRGETYLLMQRYDEALVDLNRALNLDSQSARTLGNRGELYRLTGRYDEALTDLNRAIELLPDNDWLLHHRNLVYQALDQANKQS